MGNQRRTILRFCSLRESEPRRQDPPEPSGEPKNNHFPPSESPEPGARTPRNRVGSQRITIFIAPRARYSAPGPPGTERGKKIPLENSFSEHACHRFSLLSLQGALAYGIGLWLAYDYLIEFFALAYDWLMGRLHDRLSHGARYHRPHWNGCPVLHPGAFWDRLSHFLAFWCILAHPGHPGAR